MNEFTKILGEMTINGSIAIVLVMIFRLIFRKVPKKITVIFWSIVGLRLICPFNFSMGFGLMDLLPKKEAADVVPTQILTAPVNVQAPMIADMKPQEIVTAAAVPAKASGLQITPAMILFGIWITGIAVIFVIQMIRYIRICRIFGINGLNEAVIESDKIDSPFVMGVYAPTIVLPKLIDSKERDYLILHEKIHIKYADNLTRAVGLGIACIHWFNPLVWIAYRMLLSDLEMRVDEEVIRLIGDSVKKDYCMSIVNHALHGSRYQVLGASFAKKTIGGLEVKMRINNIINYRKISALLATVIVVTSVGVTAVLSSCASEAQITSALKMEETTGAKTETETTEETGSEVIENVAASQDAGGWTAPGLQYMFRSVPADNHEASLEFLKTYGERKLFDQNGFAKLRKSESVTADYYKGTDFYDLAVLCEDEGYSIADHVKRYEQCGGTFFNEGFTAGWSDDYYMGDSVEAFRSDYRTLVYYIEKCLLNDSVIESKDLVEEEDTCKLTYTARQITYGKEYLVTYEAELNMDTMVAVVRYMGGKEIPHDDVKFPYEEDIVDED